MPVLIIGKATTSPKKSLIRRMSDKNDEGVIGMFVDRNEVTGRFHIYSQFGSDLGISYARRSDANRGLKRMLAI
jgi:hypothetical protein